jgi:hypothetical protein
MSLECYEPGYLVTVVRASSISRRLLIRPSKLLGLVCEFDP